MKDKATTYFDDNLNDIYVYRVGNNLFSFDKLENAKISAHRNNLEIEKLCRFDYFTDDTEIIEIIDNIEIVDDNIKLISEDDNSQIKIKEVVENTTKKFTKNKTKIKK